MKPNLESSDARRPADTYRQRPDDIPQDLWDGAAAAFSRGVRTDGTSVRAEIARALLAERLKERAACEAVAREHQRARWGGPDNDPNVVLRKTALSIAHSIRSRP